MYKQITGDMRKFKGKRWKSGRGKGGRKGETIQGEKVDKKVDILDTPHI